MKTLGTIAMAGISVAALAKIMHWPGASILILLSTFIVSTVFFPAALYVWYKEVFQKKHGFIVILAFLSGFAFMNGTLFKIQHWPFANSLLVIGEFLTILTIVIGGISFLLSNQSKKYSKALIIAGIIGVVGFSFGTLFKIQHWPGATIMLLIGSVLLFSIFLPIYAYNYYKNESTVKNSFIFSVFAIMFITAFTFLLTIKSSESILDAYAYRVNELHSSISVMDNQIIKISEIDKSIEINQKADELYNSITDLKNDLASLAGVTNINTSHLKLEDIFFLKHTSSHKTNVKLLEGDSQNGKVYSLYNDIQEYKTYILTDLRGNSADFIDEALYLSEDNPQEWIQENFYKIPLAISLNNLSQIQLDIRLAQQEALQSIKLVTTDVQSNTKQQ